MVKIYMLKYDLVLIGTYWKNHDNGINASVKKHMVKYIENNIYKQILFCVTGLRDIT